METLIQIIIVAVVIGFIINKQKPEWIDWIKSKIKK
tara:strand:- start:611 stop:718 length:108 start_codon:yes stop_codon:yes gene_type:complete